MTRVINFIALLLVVIGALNWGMIGFFKRDIISMIFSHGLSRIIFGAVGLAGLWALTFFRYFEEKKLH
jgi:uncharacterized protein